MAITTAFNGTIYNVPETGESGWGDEVTNLLVDLATNAATTVIGRQAIRVATSSPVTVASATDYTVLSNLTVAGAVATNLPAGIDKQIFIVGDDKGDASSNNVTITPDGADTINGGASLILNNDKEVVVLQYHLVSTDWKILGLYRDFASIDAHIAASSAVHGITGDVVGTTDAQTLTNKTIDADNSTISNLAHGAEVDEPSSGVHGVTGSIVGTTDAQTLTNKTINTFLFSEANVTIVTNAVTVNGNTVNNILGTGPLNTINGGSSDAVRVIKNITGSDLTINNNSGVNGIITGTGAAITLADDAMLLVWRSSTDSRWYIVGETGGAGGGSPGVTPQGITTTDLTSSGLTIASGTTQFHPNITIDTGDTYTVNGRFVTENITVNGTLTIASGGSCRVL